MPRRGGEDFQRLQFLLKLWVLWVGMWLPNNFREVKYELIELKLYEKQTGLKWPKNDRVPEHVCLFKLIKNRTKIHHIWLQILIFFKISDTLWIGK